jgi:hypothetical protein
MHHDWVFFRYEVLLGNEKFCDGWYHLSFDATCFYGQHYRLPALYRIIGPHPIRLSKNTQLTIVLDGQAGERIPGTNLVDVHERFAIQLIRLWHRTRVHVVRIPSLVFAK